MTISVKIDSEIWEGPDSHEVSSSLTIQTDVPGCDVVEQCVLSSSYPLYDKSGQDTTDGASFHLQGSFSSSEGTTLTKILRQASGQPASDCVAVPQRIFRRACSSKDSTSVGPFHDLGSFSFSQTANGTATINKLTESWDPYPSKASYRNSASYKMKDGTTSKVEYTTDARIESVNTSSTVQNPAPCMTQISVKNDSKVRDGSDSNGISSLPTLQKDAPECHDAPHRVLCWLFHILESFSSSDDATRSKLTNNYQAHLGKVEASMNDKQIDIWHTSEYMPKYEVTALAHYDILFQAECDRARTEVIEKRKNEIETKNYQQHMNGEELYLVGIEDQGIDPWVEKKPHSLLSFLKCVVPIKKRNRHIGKLF